MFIQHKQLKSLQVAAEKVTHLHAASSSVQLAFSGYPPQLCRAYLFKIASGRKELVVVSFYLMENQSAIFFVPKLGEVEAVEADNVYEEGYNFVESMGFVLTETDFHLLAADKKKSYWDALPFCQPPQKTVNHDKMIAGQLDKANPVLEKELQELKNRSLESLGRFLASM